MPGQDIAFLDRLLGSITKRALVRTLEEVLAGAGEWMVVVDANGFVTMISEEYAEFNGTTVAEAMGRHVTEVIENTRMHVVVKAGTAEIGEWQTIRGRELIVNRIPLNDGGRIIGGYGRVVFKTVELKLEIRAYSSNA